MTGEEKLEKVFQYINRKADFGNTLSVGNARRAAQFAYDAGRESCLENVPELKWQRVYKDGPYLAVTVFNWFCRIEFVHNEFNLFCNSYYISCYLSLSAAKQAANEHYKKQIERALGL